MTFRCSSDVNNSIIFWYNNDQCSSYDTANDCARGSRIYNGFRLTDKVSSTRFSVNEANNATHVTRDLNINSAQSSDAGGYVCVQNIPGQTARQIRSAQLVVLGNCLVYSPYYYAK